jgi:hypothetical protein
MRLRGRHAVLSKTILLLAALVAVGSAYPSPAGAQAGAKPDGRTSMKIRIELPRQRFLAKEAMQARVSVVNDGAQPIEVPDPKANVNWQPTYFVKGPAFPNGQVFSFRSAVYGSPGSDASGRTAMTVTIAPGHTHTVQLPLEELVTLAKPGEYLLAAALEWGNLKARSDPVSFTIEAPAFRSLQFVTAPSLQRAFPIRVFGLVGDSDPRVYLALFTADQNTGQVTLKSLSNFVQSAPGATSVFGPWMSFEGVGTPAPRAGWQAGATLGMAGFGEKGVTLALPTVPRVVLPALMARSGDTDVFVLEDASNRLSMLRFPKGGAPSVLWTQALPGKVLAGTAALGMQQSGEGHVAVLISARADGLSATLVAAGQGNAGPKMRPVDIPGVQVLTGSQPAARVLASGAVQASLVVTQPSQGSAAPRAAVVDLTWPADANAHGQASVNATAVQLAQPPRGAATGYPHASGAKDRRDWVLVFQNGEVASSASATQRRLKGTAVEPLQLFLGTQGTYLLSLSEERLPSFEPLF